MGVSWGSVAWAPSSARVPCGDQWEGALGGQDVWCWRGDWDPLWEESFLPRPLRTSSWMETMLGRGMGGQTVQEAWAGGRGGGWWAQSKDHSSPLPTTPMGSASQGQDHTSRGGGNWLRPSLSLASGSQGSLCPTLGSTGPFRQAPFLPSVPLLSLSSRPLPPPRSTSAQDLLHTLSCPVLRGPPLNPPFQITGFSLALSQWCGRDWAGSLVTQSLTLAELRSGSLKWASGGQGAESWVTPAEGPLLEGQQEAGSGAGKRPIH